MPKQKRPYGEELLWRMREKRVTGKNPPFDPSTLNHAKMRKPEPSFFNKGIPEALIETLQNLAMFGSFGVASNLMPAGMDGMRDLSPAEQEKLLKMGRK